MQTWGVCKNLQELSVRLVQEKTVHLGRECCKPNINDNVWIEGLRKQRHIGENLPGQWLILMSNFKIYLDRPNSSWAQSDASRMAPPEPRGLTRLPWRTNLGIIISRMITFETLERLHYNQQPVDGSLGQRLQLGGKELGASEDWEEVLGNSLHKCLQWK